MTIASNFVEDHVLVQSAQKFKEDIESETDGRFSVEISPGGAYGSASEITELTRDGGVDGSVQGTAPFDQYTPGYFFFQNPFVPKDYDHILRIMDHDLFQPAYEKLRSEGNQRQVGNVIYRGTRQTVTKEGWGPIRSVDDLEGLQPRITPWETWQRTWRATGVDPVAIDWPEVYTALETGTADAAEAPPESLRSASIYEVVDYLSQTDNLTTVGSMFVREEFYQGLDETYQDLVDELALSASEYGTEMAMEEEQTHYDFFEEQGIEIVPREEIDRGSIVDAAASAIEELFAERWESDYETIQSI
ncbi:TRAP transporter substrate-binding protein [Haloplanus halobius]|uniref:TRAP transporter substrate-binding protein n=1 Tax=Haloplanus halobius TaxID=2934938 RepID=UPI00200D00DA|nr:TRAP transporter substrate-binding protein [Haloplanus sp. XH21]